MLSKNKFYHYLRTRLVFPLILIVVMLANSRNLVYAFKQNLFAIHSLQLGTTVLFGAPWANHSWWHTVCRHENNYLEPDLLNTFNTKADFTYLQAIFAIIQGDCNGAASTLKTIIYRQPNAYVEQALLAYVYSMTGEWIESATLSPVGDIPEGNWTMRRYWGNVFLRAGLSSGSEIFVQESESLFGIYRPDGNEALYKFWIQSDNIVAAFEELRRFVAEPNAIRSPEFLENYQSLAKQYVALKVADNPESEKWQWLSGQLTTIESSTSHNQPDYVLNYKWDEQWMLWGFTIDEAELALGPFMTVTLYWLPMDTVSHEGLLIEHRIVQNYVSDAGFEWGTPISGVRPFGYNALYNNRYPYPYEIMLDGAEQQFCLLNNQELQNTGIQTLWFPSPTSSNRLIVGGNYQTEQGGKATLGFRWRGDDGDIKNNHVVAGGSSSQWQSVVESVEIPHQAEEIAFQILQFQSTGMACFDDLFMFVLNDPTSEIK